MDRPLEIAFHGIEGSPALEEAIRQQAGKLEQHCKSLVSCRVTLEGSAGKSQPHGHVSVHILLGLPGRTIPVMHDPHHAKEQRSHPDAYTAVRDAFRIAERQVQDIKG